MDFLKSAQYIATADEGPEVIRIAGVVLTLLSRTKAKSLPDLNRALDRGDNNAVQGIRKTLLTDWQMEAMTKHSAMLAPLTAAPLVHLIYCSTCGEHCYSGNDYGSRCRMNMDCGEKTIHKSKKATLVPKGQAPAPANKDENESIKAAQVNTVDSAADDDVWAIPKAGDDEIWAMDADVEE
ncbi:hypothetical protein [Brevibacterium aurantiacum]|uniref:Uncharacterized protein n=1 Tax=Brevibacterium aurantiacum TaxID=273384 RepID=A0A1D7W739_BREAU|nr:hypothetical protein [Brevibacterium aurantiacum]AOP54458.1 hypothetical protein BLSMQ_2752 [Brevibacterium aurantiacum]RCS97529.1 hypothetical protein CIK60_12035 [Brevibacterium aurantiacum]